MESLTIKFDTLPLWLTHADASKLMKSSELKALREDGKLTYRRIEDKLCYLLVDVFAILNIQTVFTHAKTELETNLVDRKDKEDTSKQRKFAFGELFTNPAFIPEGKPSPALRITIDDKKSYVDKTAGHLVDVQVYKSIDKSENEVIATRFILESLVDPDTYLILKLRCDNFYTNIMINLLLETIIEDIQHSQSNFISIELSRTEGNKPYYSTSGNTQVSTADFETETLVKLPSSQIIPKAKYAQQLLDGANLRKIVLTHTTDKLYRGEA